MEQFIKETIKKAGVEVLKLFGSREIVGTKDTVVDIVTEADLLSQKIISEAIKNTYPKHGIISEEAEEYNKDAEYVWYIDPLDGTKNFASHVPLWGINVALAHNGKVINAAIYLPVTDELCYAEEGKGSYLNGSEMHCSTKMTWDGVYGIGTIRPTPQLAAFSLKIAEVSKNTAWINAIASPAVSAVYMADGRRDFYISSGKNSWDFSAPWLICKEAGCVIKNFSGQDWNPGDKGIAISNSSLFPELFEIVKSSYGE